MTEVATPISPSHDWLSGFLHPNLLKAKPYHLHQPDNIHTKLDQNECPWDWPKTVKNAVLNQLADQNWNRYPEPFCQELTQLIAQHAQVNPDQVITGPGSNFLITLLLDTIARQATGTVVIARPSFALFEGHCQASGIAYKPWLLDHNFDYDLNSLPHMPPGSLLLFATPNNPTGSYLKPEQLRHLLNQNPQSLIIADEAYHEFAQADYGSLCQEFDNLVLIRTFSKTFASAGLRLGYCIGHASLIQQLIKPRLPYLLNHFSLVAAKMMLVHPEMQEFLKRHISQVKKSRTMIYTALQRFGQGKGLQVKDSHANFLLLRFQDHKQSDYFYQKLIEHGIMIRDISKGPGLRGCLRMSLGTDEQTQIVITAVEEIFEAWPF